jgi:hypothetical protein
MMIHGFQDKSYSTGRKNRTKISYPQAARQRILLCKSSLLAIIINSCSKGVFICGNKQIPSLHFVQKNTKLIIKNVAIYNSKECLFLKRFTMQDTFCDEEEIKSGDLPGMQCGKYFYNHRHWYKSVSNSSLYQQIIYREIVSTGFKEGFGAAHENLDKLLKR